MRDEHPEEWKLRTRAKDSHKGDFGRALLIGGSRGMAGSIAMSSFAALRTGSGLVTAAIPDRCLETVAAIHPAIMTVACPDDPAGRFSVESVVHLKPFVQGASAIGVGPGMSIQPGSIAIVHELLEHHRQPRVFDADALNVLGDTESWQTAFNLAGAILTPHPGEMQRLTGIPASDRPSQIQEATEIGKRTGAVVVLKGGPTEVVDANSRYTNTTGNPGMSTAGSGDVLTGVLTSLLGQGLSAWDAAKLGVWMHGRAGDIAKEKKGEAAMTAMEIIDALEMPI